jgi:hypothetical protein
MYRSGEADRLSSEVGSAAYDGLAFARAAADHACRAGWARGYDYSVAAPASIASISAARAWSWGRARPCGQARLPVDRSWGGRRSGRWPVVHRTTADHERALCQADAASLCEWGGTSARVMSSDFEDPDSSASRSTAISPNLYPPSGGGTIGECLPLTFSAAARFLRRPHLRCHRNAPRLRRPSRVLCPTRCAPRIVDLTNGVPPPPVSAILDGSVRPDFTTTSLASRLPSLWRQELG